MEIVKYHVVFFMTVISFLCSETAAYGAIRIRQDFKTLKAEMTYIREDISALFNKTNQLNMSAVEGCGPCVSVNKTSCPPVTNHNGKQDVLKLNDNNAFVKYHGLIKAFVFEKKINRELQDKLRSMESKFSASEIVANERDRELQSRLQSVENIISASEKVGNERDRELQRRLQSVENIISASEKVGNERHSEVQSRLQWMAESISVSGKVANERDRELQSRLRSIEESIEDKISDIYRDLGIITSFMTLISNRLEENLQKAETTSVKPDITTVPIINTNCGTVPESGVYTLHPGSIMSSVNVYCDQNTDGGGWIVFMRRQDGSVNFSRSWFDYKLGFGSPDGEFWAGNELLHKLTKERPLQLRIDMENFERNTAYAMYEEFQVGAETDKYRLHVHGYSGTAGDSLIDTRGSATKHAGMQFSTFDSDNDYFYLNCAEIYEGGWWYNDCFDSNLNGPYSHDTGIIWYSWLGEYEPLKRVEMKIR